MRIQNNPVSFQNGKVLYKITKNKPIATSIGSFRRSDTMVVTQQELVGEIAKISKKFDNVDFAVMTKNIKKAIDDMVAKVEEKAMKEFNKNPDEKIGHGSGLVFVIPKDKPTVVVNLQEKLDDASVLYTYLNNNKGPRPFMEKKPIGQLLSDDMNFSQVV